MNNEAKGKGNSDLARREHVARLRAELVDQIAEMEKRGGPTASEKEKLVALARHGAEIDRLTAEVDRLDAERTGILTTLKELAAPIDPNVKFQITVDPSAPKSVDNVRAVHSSRETHPDLQFRKMKPWKDHAEREVKKHGAQALVNWLHGAIEGRNRSGQGNTTGDLGTAISFQTILAVVKQASDPYAWQETFNSLGGRMLLTLSQRLHQQLIGDSAERAAAEAVMELMADWHLALFHLTGNKTYEISPGLAQRLAATELRGLKTDDLRLPFKSIYLVVPREAGLKVMHSKYGLSPVVGCYLVEDNRGDVVGGKDGSLLATSVNPQEGVECRTWRFMFVGEPPVDAVARGEIDADGGETLFTFVVRLPEGQTLEAALGLEESRVVKENDRKVIGTTTRQVLDFYKHEWRKLFAWMMNAIIYATWPDAEVDHVTMNREARQLWERIQKLPRGSKKKAELQARHKEMNPQHRIYLGRSTPRWTQADTHERSAHGKLTVRVLVQGHWKNQPYGEGRAYRKRIYIEPYWRGPEAGEVISNPHVLIAGSDDKPVDNSVTTVQDAQVDSSSATSTIPKGG